MNRNLINIATTLAVAAGAIGRLNGAAQASTTEADTSAAVTMAGPAYLLNYGNNADFPTWLFGNTRIHAEHRIRRR